MTLARLAIAVLHLVPALARGSEAERLVDLLQLAPGMTVADVGAGDGQWTESLARAVAPDGHVFATEIESDLIEKLLTEIDERSLVNVTPLLGTQEDSGLADGCCDAILLRMVYHHFENPAAMRGSLRQAMRPGALIAIVEINPQQHWRRLTDVPDRDGHGIEPEELIEEMVSEAFELVSLHTEWNEDRERYCAVFRRGGGTD